MPFRILQYILRNTSLCLYYKEKPALLRPFRCVYCFSSSVSHHMVTLIIISMNLHFLINYIFSWWAVCSESELPSGIKMYFLNQSLASLFFPEPCIMLTTASDAVKYMISTSFYLLKLHASVSLFVISK